MGYEIINSAQVTPRRLHALLELAARLEGSTRSQLGALLQPEALSDNREAFTNVYRAALACGLLAEPSSEDDPVVTLACPRDSLEASGAFRRLMSDRLLGVTKPEQANYMFNQYAAWYAVQDDRVFRYATVDFESEFVDRLYPNVQPRPFNTEKLPGWRTWAAFIGWGWPIRVAGRRELIVPDARVRLEMALPRLGLTAERQHAMTKFMHALAKYCPELDGGELFEPAWQASRGAEPHSQRISLMLSTGLRALHARGRIKLIRQADAKDLWLLFPAAGHELSEISHVQLTGGE